VTSRRVQLRGIGVSPGIAMGKALIMERETVPVLRLPLAPGQSEHEVQRLSQAVEASRAQLQAVKDRLSAEVGVPHAYIFDAQLLMLEDPLLVDRSVGVIREDRVNAEWAVRTVSEQLHTLFDGFTDAYLKERSTDLDDVLGRIQLNLAGETDAPSLSRLPEPFVLVADDLKPSEAAELDWEKVLAVVLDAGSRTYHTAILTRSLGIPGVVGLKDASHRIRPGALVVVDGATGEVVVGPSGRALSGYRAAQKRGLKEERRLQETRGLAGVTRDGTPVRLRANAEFPGEAVTAVLYGAEGIGLFRSEYLLARSREWPSEEQQLDVYRRLLEQMRPHPVTVRTWDLGPEDLGSPERSSPNPALGPRAFRLLSRAPDRFREQLRALLRAGRHGPLRIMFPFLGGPSDLRTALGFFEEVRDGLLRDGVEFGEAVPVGIHIEVPSAALTADLLAPEVDFFSVGTNDLTQYLLAVDRADPGTSSPSESLHPAVLRTVLGIVDAAERHQLSVSLCGEMAADPLQALALLGLGVREFSMSPAAIPRVKAAVRGVTTAHVREVAHACLDLPTAGEIEATLRAELGTDLGT
jgi:phosphotransferase system enzyme I (PtsI)